MPPPCSLSRPAAAGASRSQSATARRRSARVELAVAMRETDNVPLVEWPATHYVCSRHACDLEPGEPTPVPRLLRLADETVELVWDTPNPRVIAPVDDAPTVAGPGICLEEPSSSRATLRRRVRRW